MRKNSTTKEGGNNPATKERKKRERDKERLKLAKMLRDRELKESKERFKKENRSFRTSLSHGVT